MTDTMVDPVIVWRARQLAAVDLADIEARIAIRRMIHSSQDLCGTMIGALVSVGRAAVATTDAFIDWSTAAELIDLWENA